MNRSHALEVSLRQLYGEHHEDLPYHGLEHVLFVASKADLFASWIGADAEIVRAAALTHDLNYVVQPLSQAEDGKELRGAELRAAGYSEKEVRWVEQVVVESTSRNRAPGASAESQALADADMLFKALPVTPILFAREYLREGDRTLTSMAQAIVDNQRPLIDSGEFFYSPIVRARYMRWAETNVRLWENLLECIMDADVLAAIPPSVKI